MSDDELREVKAMWANAAPLPTDVCALVVALADEALVRGAQRDDAMMRLNALRMPIPEVTVQALLDDAASHLDARVRDLRERAAQLETALQFYGDPMTYKAGAGCEYWLVPIEQDMGEKARAALAAGKP